MKKFIVPVVALLLFAGASNAQTALKTKPMAASTKTMTKQNNTASVTPAKTTTTTKGNSAAAITRKHHKKAHKAVPKKG